jgi:hypothetical protein
VYHVALDFNQEQKTQLKLAAIAKHQPINHYVKDAVLEKMKSDIKKKEENKS